MKRILLIIVLLFCSVLGFGQESNILCTQVNEDGTTTIFFTSSSEIVSVAYYNTNTNMFENIGDINVSTQTSFIDTLIANNSTERQIRYRVSTPSNTSYGNTMFLEVTNLTNSSFRLDWTSPHPSPSQQLEGTEGNQYIIFRKFASDVSWEQIGTTLDTNYTDEFLLRCSDTVSYRVELPNSSYSCSSVSNVKKLIIGDHEIPTEPILLTSSVDLDSQTLNLTWTPSTSLDTWGYIVCKGNPRIAIDTIWGSEQSTYTCLICSVEEVDTLSIMAFDTCYNTSLITNPHMNIVLNYYREACSAEIKFDWTQYFADPVNVITYELYVSQNNQDFVLHQTFTQDITSTTFIADPTIVSYCFYIKATLSNAYQVNSNKVCSSQALPKQVDFAYIRNTIVSKENDVVEMEFYVDASLEVRGYDLYRSSNNIDFTLIKTLPYTGNNTFIYTDKPPIALNKSNYFYKLHVPDECDLLFTPSNTISTIRLTIDVSNPDINVLNWNPFIGWNSIDSYDIYRIDGTSPSGFPIDNVQSTSNRYEDNIKSMISVSDKITYYIVAKESGASPDGHLTESHSSTASVVKESLIFVPNSFTPFENVNDVFKPFCSFIRLGTYSFKVYNRSGELIFETKDTEKGWDGKYKGRYCPVATYVYKVEFINSEGERVSKAGTVNLIN